MKFNYDNLPLLKLQYKRQSMTNKINLKLKKYSKLFYTSAVQYVNHMKSAHKPSPHGTQ